MPVRAVPTILQLAVLEAYQRASDTDWQQFLAVSIEAPSNPKDSQTSYLPSNRSSSCLLGSAASSRMVAVRMRVTGANFLTGEDWSKHALQVHAVAMPGGPTLLGSTGRLLKIAISRRKSTIPFYSSRPFDA